MDDKMESEAVIEPWVEEKEILSYLDVLGKECTLEYVKIHPKKRARKPPTPAAEERQRRRLRAKAKKREQEARNGQTEEERRVFQDMQNTRYFTHYFREEIPPLPDSLNDLALTIEKIHKKEEEPMDWNEIVPEFPSHNLQGEYLFAEGVTTTEEDTPTPERKGEETPFRSTSKHVADPELYLDPRCASIPATPDIEI